MSQLEAVYPDISSKELTAGAEGNEALSTMVAPGPPVKGEDAELIPTKEGSEFLTHLVDSIGKRKAEGVGMLLSLTGVDILNVS